MSRKRSGHRRRFARRLVVGGVIGAGVIFGLSQVGERRRDGKLLGVERRAHRVR